MEILADVTAEELRVFLQEAEDQIQMLDEDIVALEKNGGNQALMQEIFRAAHTLKGSSAMVGHQRLTEVAHAMETLLDGLRKGEIPCTAETIDALLSAVDAIRALKPELTQGVESDALVAQVVATLKAVGARRPAEDAAREEYAEPADGIATDLRTAAERGEPCWRVKVSFDLQSSWTAVRMLQALNKARSLGTVAWYCPTIAEVEAEKVGTDLEILLVTTSHEGELRAALAGLEEVVQLVVGLYTAGDGGLPATGADQSRPGGPIEPRGDSVNGSKEHQIIKIEVTLLDKFMDLVSELVIERSRVSQVWGYRRGPSAQQRVHQYLQGGRRAPLQRYEGSHVAH